MNEDIIYEVLSVVNEIPQGKVTTYGQIAKMINREKNARLVGKILRFSSNYGDFPSHRVVNSNGRLVIGWTEQKDLLLNEGITFKANGLVNLKKHLWTVE